ncbi:MAG: hypothetical protein WEC14_11405 [Chloroflexota bacterium]
MTTPRSLDQHLQFDLPLRAARERIASLHAAARPPELRGVHPTGHLRDAIGAWLIGLGAALASDEALRQRVAPRAGRPVP